MKLQKITQQKQHTLHQSKRVEQVYSPSTPINLREFLHSQATEFRSAGRKDFLYERGVRQNASQSGAYTPASSRRLPARKKLLVYGTQVYLEVEVPSRYIVLWDAQLGLDHEEQYIGTKHANGSKEYEYRFYHICTLTPGVRVRDVEAKHIRLEDSQLLYKPQLIRLLGDMMPSDRDLSKEYCLHNLIRDVAIPMRCYHKRDERGLYKPAEQVEQEQQWGQQLKNKPKNKKRKFKTC